MKNLKLKTCMSIFDFRPPQGCELVQQKSPKKNETLRQFLAFYYNQFESQTQVFLSILLKTR